MESLINLILVVSMQFSEDPYLIASIVHVESSFNPNAVGSSGEIGLMQLKPKYFEPKYLYPITKTPFFLSGISIFEYKSRNPLYYPEINIRIGVRHIKKLRRICGLGSDFEVVQCFNKGVAGAKKSGFSEQDEYYKKVMFAYSDFKNKNSLGNYNKQITYSYNR